MVKLTGRAAEIGLGLRPDLTGRGLGESFVRACLRFASAALGAQRYTLAVAALNRRAITVYERAGFREAGRFEHHTNGGVHAFIRMTRDTIEAPALRAAGRRDPVLLAVAVGGRACRSGWVRRIRPSLPPHPGIPARFLQAQQVVLRVLARL